MELEEANKIIAEYMGEELYHRGIDGTLFALVDKSHKVNNHYPSKPIYSRSLDALVPVWHKMEKDNNYGGICIYSCIIGKEETFTVSSNLIREAGGFKADSHEYDEGSSTLQEAAALATAKAIQGLG